MVVKRLTFLFIISASVFTISTILKESDAAKATEHTYVDHVICRYNPEYTENCTCKLNFITRLKKSFTSMCLLTKPLHNVMGHTQLYHRFRSGYQIFLIDRIINVCDYLNHNATSKIIDIVLPKFKQYLSSNVTLTCPYQGRFDIDSLPLDGALLDNMFLPVGNYFVNLTVFVNESHDFIWNGKFYFIIPEGKTIEDDRMGR